MAEQRTHLATEKGEAGNSLPTATRPSSIPTTVVNESNRLITPTDRTQPDYRIYSTSIQSLRCLASAGPLLNSKQGWLRYEESY